MWFEERDVKDVVEGSERGGKLESPSMGRDDRSDFEGAKSFMIQLLHRSFCADVPSDKPD